MIETTTNRCGKTYGFIAISFIVSLAATLVDSQQSSCSQTVNNLSNKCPVLTNLLELTKQNTTKQEFIRDIQSVLDENCCEGLRQLQLQRCFCDIGFLQALQYGKTIDNFTMYLLMQSVKFECGFQIEYGSNCTDLSSSPIIEQNSTAKLVPQKYLSDTSTDENFSQHNLTHNKNTTFNSHFPQQSQEKISINDTQKIIYGNLLSKYENINRDEYNFIQDYYGQQEQQYQLPQFQVPQDVQNLRGTPKIVYSNNYIYSSNSSQQSQNPSYSKNVITTQNKGITFQQQEDLFFRKNASHIFQPSRFSAPLNFSAQNNFQTASATSIAQVFQKLPNINNTQNAPDVHNVKNAQHAYDGDDVISKTEIQAYSDYNSKDYYGKYEEDQEFRKGDLVFKSVDKDDDQLKKQPRNLAPQVEQLFHSETVATYIDWAVSNQRQKQIDLDFGGNFSTQSDYAPQTENEWQYRAAHVDCDGNAMIDMAYYKDASIIGECIRQAQKTLQTQEYLVLVAPKNPGFLKWLRLDANMSLVQFFSNDEQMKEVVGRHVAFSRPLNFKGMIDGQVITLHSMQGTLLTISLKNQQYMVNGIKIDTIHYSCDGVILVTSTPIPAPYIQTRTQEPQIQSGLEALIPLLMFPNESATPSALPQFKLNTVDLLEGQPLESQTYVVQEEQQQQQQQQQEQQQHQQQYQIAQYLDALPSYQQQQEQQCSYGSIFDLLKESFPGFAYLASQQGFQDVLTNAPDITVFVPRALGQGIKIDDYIMSQALQKKDFAWLGSGVELSMFSGSKQKVETMQGGVGDILIGGSHITTWDTKACNGVMHVMEYRFNNSSGVGVSLAAPLSENKTPFTIVVPQLPPTDEAPITEISLESMLLSPPPPPLLLHLGSNFSLIRVAPQSNELHSTNYIHSLVSDMMSSP